MQNTNKPNHYIEERQDIIFRKVRGILNKITPETFDKLSKELINVGLDSPRTLRGVIYLLFDKALKDLKYSSLYAKLCQELSEKAPNFEQESGPNTFCKFLISKCEDEFERRRKATEDFDSKNELTDEEYELRAIAKQKMLGNIKFICELGKKRLLQEEILHECIRGLLSKKKERPIQDQAQDLECLCQIMRTIGSLLDFQASRNLMNQYFERIDLLSRKSDLPSRIRFMLRDVIDLRNNNWRPRPFQREDNVPQPLSKLREQAGYDPGSSSTLDKFGNNRNLIGISDLSRLHGNKLNMLLDDEPSFTTITDFHWGPAFLPHDQSFDAFTSTGPEHQSPNSLPAPTISSSSLNPTFKQPPPPPPPIGLNDPFSMRRGRTLDNQSVLNKMNPRHIADQRKEVEGIAFERKPFPEQNIALSYNDKDFSVFSVKNRANISVPQTNQSSEDQRSSNLQKHEVNGQQHHITRGRSISPNSRHPIRRNPPPQLRGPNKVLVQPHMDQNFRQESRAAQHEIPDNRERGLRRPEVQEHGHRPVRTANNPNYRSSRNDRMPGRDLYQFERPNLPPDSGLNFNWRTGPVTSSVAAAKDPTTSLKVLNQSNMQRPPQVQPSGDNSFVESKFFNSNLNQSRTPNNQSSNIRQRIAEPIKDKLQIVDRTVQQLDREFLHPNLKNQPTDLVTSNNNVRIQHRNDPVELTPRFGLENRIAKQPHAHPTAPPPRRSINDAPQQRGSSPQNFRNAPKPITEAVDYRRVQTSFPQNAENQNPRPLEDGPGQDRTYRAPVEKRHTIDNHPIPESDRTPNWRKGNNAVGNLIREQTNIRQPLTPLLPKPPTRVIDPNFSLRPSHNLSTRAHSQPVDSNSGTETSTVELDTKKKDQSDKQALALPQKVDGTQASASSGSPTSSKTGSGTTGFGKDRSRSHGSPTRAAARDFHVNKFISVLSECPNDSAPNVNRNIARVRELKIPKNYQHECLVTAMKQAILKSDSEREQLGKLLAQLVPSVFEASSLLHAFRMIFEQLHALEIETPKVKSLIAGLMSQAVLDGLLALEEFGKILSGGKHHPLFLLFLQKLGTNAGQIWLSDKFIASKINLMEMLPEADRSNDRLASILKDRCLGFLDPMLTIEPDLWAQMKDRDPSPSAIYRWIKDNVDQTIQDTPTFAHVLITCILKYIHNHAAEKSQAVTSEQGDEVEGLQSNKSTPSSSSQNTSDIEKEVLTKYQQVLQAILKDKRMQLATLYALQSFYHGIDFPKGSLLRWFHMLYDMNIVDDDVFFTWKEEINDNFPGKGQALFQVNTWLNWLAEDDSDEDEDV